MASAAQRLRKYRPIITLCIIVMVLISVVAVFVAIWPKYEESFFEFALLGEDKRAEDYYPNDNPNINVSSPIRWYIYIHNYMHSVQDVKIRVKLLNATMQAPNDREHMPSPYPHILEVPVHLDVDETLILPLFWSVSGILHEENLIVINELTINNETIGVSLPSFTSNRFRIVFELWVYNQSSQEYEFGWESGKNTYSASLSMWYNLTH